MRVFTEDLVDLIVECGAVPALVRHLQASSPLGDDETTPSASVHEVEKGSAFALGLLAVKVV